MASNPTAAFCNGVGACTTSVSWTARIAGVRCGGASTQPMRQPVALAVLEMELTTMVRSRIPGQVAMDRWRAPSNTMCS